MVEANEFKVPGGTVIGLCDLPEPEKVGFEPSEPEVEEKPAPKKRTKKSAETDKQ